MRWGCAFAVLIAATVGIVVGYEFVEDSRLGGMPQTEADVAIQASCATALSEILAGFASSHSLNLSAGKSVSYSKQQLVETNDSFDLSRWNAEIIVEQYRENCSVKLRCYYVYVEYKGWLWWTSSDEADQLFNDLAEAIRKSACAERIVLVLHTKPPR